MDGLHKLHQKDIDNAISELVDRRGDLLDEVDNINSQIEDLLSRKDSVKRLAGDRLFEALYDA